MKLTQDQIAMAIVAVAVIIAVYYMYTQSMEPAVGGLGVSHGLGALMTPEQKRQAHALARRNILDADEAARAVAASRASAEAANQAAERAIKRATGGF